MKYYFTKQKDRSKCDICHRTINDELKKHYIRDDHYSSLDDVCCIECYNQYKTLEYELLDIYRYFGV